MSLGEISFACIIFLALLAALKLCWEKMSIRQIDYDRVERQFGRSDLDGSHRTAPRRSGG